MFEIFGAPEVEEAGKRRNQTPLPAFEGSF
jgi:hypothetical protein